MSRLIDLTGQKFGRLTVLKRDYTTRGVYWVCQCECGHKAYVDGRYLRKGITKSCGCLQRECVKQKATSHGQSKTRLYKKWADMKGRCNNPNNSLYPYYGARGIKVCEEWDENFEAFQNWALKNGYKEELSLGRIDKNGDFNETNCKWMTKSELITNKNENN